MTTATKQAQRTPDAVFVNPTAKAITLDMFRVQAEAKQAVIDDLLAVARRCDELLSVICAANHPRGTAIAIITDLRAAIAKAEA